MCHSAADQLESRELPQDAAECAGIAHGLQIGPQPPSGCWRAVGISLVLDARLSVLARRARPAARDERRSSVTSSSRRRAVSFAGTGSLPSHRQRLRSSDTRATSFQHLCRSCGWLDSDDRHVKPMRSKRLASCRAATTTEDPSSHLLRTFFIASFLNSVFLQRAQVCGLPAMRSPARATPAPDGLGNDPLALTSSFHAALDWRLQASAAVARLTD